MACRAGEMHTYSIKLKLRKYLLDFRLFYLRYSSFVTVVIICGLTIDFSRHVAFDFFFPSEGYCSIRNVRCDVKRQRNFYFIIIKLLKFIAENFYLCFLVKKKRHSINYTCLFLSSHFYIYPVSKKLNYSSGLNFSF